MSCLQTVQTIYEAFGRGDIATVLSKLSPVIEWESPPPHGAAAEVPWLRPRRGLEGAAEFFAALSAVELTKFHPKHLFEAQGVVYACIDIEGFVRATGSPFVEEDEIHIWTFDNSGQVIRFRHRVDTWQHLEAWRASP